MTDLRPERLRRGEVIAGLCGGTLLVAGGRGAATPLPVLAAASGLALAYAQATREAPALPVTLSVVATTLGAAATGSLLHRALRRRGDRAGSGPPSIAGLAAAAGLTAGAFLSLRQEDGWVPDAEHPVELVPLTS